MIGKHVKTFKMFKKCLVIALAFVIAGATIGMPSMSTYAQEEEDISYTIQTNVNEDKTELHIALQTKANRSDVEITKIGNPDGTFSVGDDTTYVAKSNAKLTFSVNYKISEEQDGKIKEIHKTKKIAYTVDELGAKATKSASVASNAIPANMSFRNGFKVSSSSYGVSFLNDNSLEFGRHHKEYVKVKIPKARSYTYWKGYYAKYAAVSNTAMDFSKNFKVSNVIVGNSTIYGEGLTLGFQTNPNFTWTKGKGGAIAAYRYGDDYGVTNGVVFEADYHGGSDGKYVGPSDAKLGNNHLAIHTTDDTGVPSAPLTQETFTRSDEPTAMNAQWYITDAKTNTGTLIFTYGTQTLKYENFKPHEVFGGTENNPNPAYLTYTGATLKDNGSNNKPQTITMTDFSYLDDALSASDGFIKQSEAKALLSPSGLIPYNNASVTTTIGTSVEPKVNAPAWSAIQSGTLGNYDVTYTHGELSKTVKLNVVEDDATISPDKDFSLFAQNATLKQSEARALLSQNDLIDVHKANVRMVDGTLKTPSVIALPWAAIKMGITGDYEVSFYFGTDDNYTQKDVVLTIKADKPHEVFAQNAFLTQSQAEKLSKTSDLIPYNNAYAITNQGDRVEIEAIDTKYWGQISSGTLGSYDVRYIYGSGEAQGDKTVKINVVEDGAVFPPDNSFALYAQDGFISKQDAQAITKMSDLSEYNNAYVVLENGNRVEPIVMTLNYFDILAGKLGSYKVSYSYGTGTNKVTKAVKLRVHDGEISPDGDFILSANSTLISQSDAKKLSDVNALIDVNNASVWMENGDTAIPDVSILPINWLALNDGIVGSYPIAYSYGMGTNYTQKTVRVTVYEDGGIVSPDKDFVLTARDAVLTQSEAKALSDKEALRDVNGALVTYVNGDTEAPNVTTSDFAAIKSGREGAYSVTYDHGTQPNHVAKSVKVVVVKDGAVFPPDRSFALYAEDVLMTQDEARDLSGQDQLISLTNAEVTLATGEKLAPSLSLTNAKWESIKKGTPGEYELVFKHEKLSHTVTLSITQEYVTRYMFDYDNNKRVDIIDRMYFESYYSQSMPMSKLAWKLSDALPADGRIDVNDLLQFKYYYSNSGVELIEVEVPEEWRLD
ncbi:MAG: hypothetical protein ACK5KR_02850 [Breznakia sp.]